MQMLDDTAPRHVIGSPAGSGCRQASGLFDDQEHGPEVLERYRQVPEERLARLKDDIQRAADAFTELWQHNKFALPKRRIERLEF